GCMIVSCCLCFSFFFFSSRRRHTRCLSDWSSDVCSSDLLVEQVDGRVHIAEVGLLICPGRSKTLSRYHASHVMALEELHGERRRSEERRVGKECRSGGESDD